MSAPAIPTTQSAKGGLGSAISRVDGRLKVTGRATYAAEAPIKDVVHAVLVSSTIASGKIKSIDASLAMSAPGVLRVVTPEHVENLSMPEKGDPMSGGGLREEERLPLGDMDIGYAGQYVVAVVAETLEQATHAANLIAIEYDVTIPVFKIQSPRADTDKPKQDMGQPLQPNKGDVDTVLKAAAASGLTVVKATYTTPVETHNPMEMHATIAAWDGTDRLTIWDATQYIMGVRSTIASAFKLKEQNVRVLCPFVGGGFGSKGAQWPHTLLAAASAKMVGRPVKLMLTRAQMFTGVGHRPATEQTMTLAAAKDGKLAALRHETRVQGSMLGDFIEPCGVGTSRVLYATPNFDITHELDKVNIASPTFMRAPGECPGTFALESAMDELSYAVGIDPLQLRLTNYADVHPMSGKPWSSKNLKECYRIGAEKFGWEKRSATPGSMKSPEGLAMGWGMATATYPGNRFPGTARIRLMRDDAGGLRAIGASSTQDLGTGSWTIFAQITATETGLPVEKVKFELGDSTLPPAPVSGGSTSAASVGQALHDAGTVLKQALLSIAIQNANSPLQGMTADQLIFQDERLVSAIDTSRSEAIAPLIERSGKAYVEGFAGKPANVGTVMQPNGENFKANQQTYEIQSFGAHFVEVVIDSPGPRVRVKRVVSVMDVGRIINPKTARSQVIGGVVMGIGMALLEGTVYDDATARPVTDNLADYAVCVNADIPQIETHLLDIPDPHFNALGVRGVGEIGITGIAAAVANAVYHATGTRVRDLPITMDKLI